MAKISISITDALKEELDEFASGNGFSRSAAVAHIFAQFFAGEVRAPTEVDPDVVSQMNERLTQVSDYIVTLHENDPEHYSRPEWMAAPVIKSQLGRMSEFLEDTDGW